MPLAFWYRILYNKIVSVIKIVRENNLIKEGDCDEKELLQKSQHELALQIQDGPDAICYDDVIDAHNFFKNLDENWEKYIPENLKKDL